MPQVGGQLSLLRDAGHATIVHVNMSGRRWPSMRPDGSISVGPRWAGTPTRLDEVEELIRRLIEGYDGASFDACFSKPPDFQREGDTVTVALHAKPGERLWKDWMVRICGDVQTAMPDLALVGFYDLVADKLRPSDR